MYWRAIYSKMHASHLPDYKVPRPISKNFRRQRFDDVINDLVKSLKKIFTEYQHHNNHVHWTATVLIGRIHVTSPTGYCLFTDQHYSFLNVQLSYSFSRLKYDDTIMRRRQSFTCAMTTYSRYSNTGLPRRKR